MAYAVRFPSHRAPIQIVTFKLFSILGEPPEDYQLQNLSLEMGKIIYFLATLVALHFTPVSK